MRVGALASFFGLTFVAQNLVTTASAAGALAWFVPGLGATVAALAVAVHLAAELSPKATRVFRAFAVASAAAFTLSTWGPFAAVFAGHEAPFAGPPLLVTAAVTGLSGGTIALLLAVVAAGLRFREAADARGRRAFAFFALAFGLFVLFSETAVYIPTMPRLADAAGAGTYALGIAILAATTVAAVALFVPGPRTPDARLASGVVLALVAAGLAGAFLAVAVADPRYGGGFGAYGIVRTVGAALLVLAIVRHDLLGVPLPRVAVSRGPVAAGALALLFVVAQVAQNFFEARYGLLLGGVIAGAFIFAAHPIQRAFEARDGGRRPRPDEGRSRRLYREAARHALRDRVMTRAEELHLAELAEELGIPAAEAARIRHKIEDAAREAGGAGSVAERTRRGADGPSGGGPTRVRRRPGEGS